MRHIATTRTSQLTFVFKIGLAAGLLVGAALLAMPSRAEDSVESQAVNARLVAHVSSALSAYAHHMDSLTQDLPPEVRARTETQVAHDYRRLSAQVSGLQASAAAVEIGEFSALQEIVAVYGEIQDRVATAAREGKARDALREAELAKTLAGEIKAGLQRIIERGNAELSQTAATGATPAVPVKPGSRVATAK